jgi:hypothetical protein
LLVSIALFSVLLGVAIPKAPQRPFVLWQANQQLLGDIRQTRADALTKGEHFRLTVTGGSSYYAQRLTLVGNEWTPIGPQIRSRTMPYGISFTSGVGASFEFNTRGLLVTPEAAAVIQIHDSITGITRRTTIWPSGQVVPL